MAYWKYLFIYSINCVTSDSAITNNNTNIFAVALYDEFMSISFDEHSQHTMFSLLATPPI